MKSAACRRPRLKYLDATAPTLFFASFINGLPTFAAFSRRIRTASEDEELLAAKMMGRWRSGAPLALCPFHDDPQLGADPQRNNAFMFEEDDTAD